MGFPPYSWTKRAVAKIFADDVQISGQSITTTGTITAGDLAATDDLTVGDDATITGDLAVTGTLAITSTTTLTGAATLTGGIVATVDRVSTIPIGAVAYGSLGNNTTPVAGTVYYTSLWLPANKTITGIAMLNGTAVGTDKIIVALYSSDGQTLLANSALAGTTCSGTDAFQEVAFTGTYAAKGPGRYWVAVQVNGTTCRLRNIAASTYLNFTGSAAGSFGTLPATITPPTTTAANVGPIAYAY